MDDPLAVGNNVLNFNSTTEGGDIFTSRTLAAGSYFLSLDILGTCNGGVCGGFAGIEDPSEQWLLGDGTWAHSFTTALVNTGAWQHIELAFTASGVFNLKLEDFHQYKNGGAPNDVYFDNICVSSQRDDSGCASASVPEPGTLALLGLGLFGLGFSRRKKA